MSSFWQYYASNICMKDKNLSKARSQINFFVTEGNSFTGGGAKLAPIQDGGQGIPHLGNILVSCTVKSLLKLARGQVKGIPACIVLNFGIAPQDILRLSNVEFAFLALTFKICNLLFWHKAVHDYI